MALLAHYRLDGDAEDALGGGTGSTQNVGWVNGKLGQAGDFVRGTGNGVWIPHDPVLSRRVFGVGTTLSFSFWVYPRAYTNYGIVIGKQSGGSYSNSTSSVWINGSGIRFQLGTNESGNPSGSSAALTRSPPLNQWHHIACVADGERMYYYIDGKLETSGPINLSRPRSENTNDIQIGTPRVSGRNEGCNAIIQDVRIYDHALSQREVRDLSLGLAHHLPLLGDAVDTATYQEAQNYGADLNSNMAYFDGSSYLKTTYYPRFYAGDSFSIALWFRTNGTGRVSEIRDASKAGNPLITLMSDASFTVLLRGSDGNRRDMVTSNLGLNDNQWHHVVVVVQGESRVYIDGRLGASNTNAVDMNIDLSDIPIHIGCRNLENNIDQYYVGDVRGYSFYHSALTDDQVKELYHQRASIDSEGSVHSGIGEVISGIGPAGLQHVNVTAENCAYFNGTDSYAYYRDFAGDLQPLEISVSAWVYVVSPSSWRHILSLGETLNDSDSWTGSAYMLWMTGDNLEVIFNGSSYRSPRVTLPTEQWVRIGAVYDGSRVKVFVGDSKTSDEPFTSGINYGGREVFQLGGHNRYSWYRGGIRDVAIVGRAVSDTEFLNGLGPETPDLISWLPMRDDTTTINNRGRVGIDASEVGPAHGLVAWYPLIGDTLDYAGTNHAENNGAVAAAEGYEFDGAAEDYVSTTLAKKDGPLSISVSCFSLGFVNSNDGVFQAQVGDSVPDTSTKPLGAWVASDGDVWGRIIQGDGTAKNLPIDGSAIILSDAWNTLTYVADGQTYSLFVNGILSKQVDYDGTILDFDSLFIGRQGTESWNGTLRDVRIYDRALSPEEVAMLHNMTRPGGSKSAITSNCLYTRGQIKEVIA